MGTPEGEFAIPVWAPMVYMFVYVYGQIVVNSGLFYTTLPLVSILMLSHREVRRGQHTTLARSYLDDLTTFRPWARIKCNKSL